MASELTCPPPVVTCLRDAVAALSRAHTLADEREIRNDGLAISGDLTGTVRDMIFGLNTAVEALAEAIESGHFGGSDG